MHLLAAHRLVFLLDRLPPHCPEGRVTQKAKTRWSWQTSASCSKGLPPSRFQWHDGSEETWGGKEIKEEELERKRAGEKD
ncbi:hypothetical protein EYF80_012811 [Liparis tanakae]|uniref:Uncharacterized protein n=1 Tax=Liparis tanakae TaxID=230148 RepID=A0A4Z2IGZ4_9TELE|nr:hypothetical protein EYF80_012811 [Liparis tanakae]